LRSAIGLYGLQEIRGYSMKLKQAVCAPLLPLALCALLGAHSHTAQTPITHVIILFQENASIDHYFATYPNAQNNSGEQAFTAFPGTPTVSAPLVAPAGGAAGR
jgi:phospholipase C